MSYARKRDHRVVVYFNDAEYDRLNKNVKKSGLSREAYLRKLVKQIQPKELPPVDFFNVLKELRQINNNMNQIAVKANATGFITSEEYWKNVRWLQDSIGKMMEAMY